MQPRFHSSCTLAAYRLRSPTIEAREHCHDRKNKVIADHGERSLCDMRNATYDHAIQNYSPVAGAPYLTATVFSTLAALPMGKVNFHFAQTHVREYKYKT